MLLLELLTGGLMLLQHLVHSCCIPAGQQQPTCIFFMCVAPVTSCKLCAPNLKNLPGLCSCQCLLIALLNSSSCRQPLILCCYLLLVMKLLKLGTQHLGAQETSGVMELSLQSHKSTHLRRCHRSVAFWHDELSQINESMWSIRRLSVGVLQEQCKALLTSKLCAVLA